MSLPGRKRRSRGNARPRTKTGIAVVLPAKWIVTPMDRIASSKAIKLARRTTSRRQYRTAMKTSSRINGTPT